MRGESVDGNSLGREPLASGSVQLLLVREIQLDEVASQAGDAGDAGASAQAQVRRQHAVEAKTAHRHAPSRPGENVLLEVVANLLHALIGEELLDESDRLRLG